MNSQQAHAAVAISLVVMLGYSLVTGKGTQAPNSFKRIWAVGALGLFLSLISDFAPAIGGPLAILFSLGYVAGGQNKIDAVVHNAIGKKASA